MKLLCFLLLSGFLPQAATPREVSELIERLGSDKPDERDRASAALKALGDGALPALRKAAIEGKGEIAARAGDIVRRSELRKRVSPRLKEIFPELEKQVLDGEPEAWTHVFTLIQIDSDPAYDRLTPEDRGIVYELAFKQARSDGERQDILKEAGTRPGPMKAGDVLPYLKIEDEEFRQLTARALGGMADPAAIPALTEALKDSAGPVRISAATSLGTLKARESSDALRHLLSDPNPAVGASAATALGRVGAADAEPSLRAALPSRGFLRVASASALADLGAADAADLLAKILEDREEPSILEQAAERLSTLGARAVPALRGCLKSPQAETRTLAVTAMKGAAGRDGIADIAALLQDPDPRVRAHVVEALDDLDAKDRVPSLVQMLSDPDGSVRRAAVMALARLGGPETTGELRKMLEDREPYVQIDAASALCSRGDLGGAPLLLKEAKNRMQLVQEVIPLTALNGLREPGTWKRLGAPPVRGSGTLRIRTALKALADDAKLTLEITESDSDDDSNANPWMQRRVPVGEAPGRRTLLELLLFWRGSGAFDFILDAGKLRVVSRKEAAEFWPKWWLDRKKQ